MFRPRCGPGNSGCRRKDKSGRRLTPGPPNSNRWHRRDCAHREPPVQRRVVGRPARRGCASYPVTSDPPGLPPWQVARSAPVGRGVAILQLPALPVGTRRCQPVRVVRHRSWAQPTQLRETGPISGPPGRRVKTLCAACAVAAPAVANLGSETPTLLEPDRYRMAIPMMRAKATYAATITSTSGTKRSAASTRPMSIPVTSPISRTQSA